MSDYKKIFNTETDEFEICCSCGSEAPLDRFPTMIPGGPERMLCEVCARTHIALITWENGVDAPIAGVIAEVANLLIEKLSPKQ